MMQERGALSVRKDGASPSGGRGCPVLGLRVPASMTLEIGGSHEAA